MKCYETSFWFPSLLDSCRCLCLIIFDCSRYQKKKKKNSICGLLKNKSWNAITKKMSQVTNVTQFPVILFIPFDIFSHVLYFWGKKKNVIFVLYYVIFRDSTIGSAQHWKQHFFSSISLTLNHDNEAANFETSEGIKKFWHAKDDFLKSSSAETGLWIW